MISLKSQRTNGSLDKVFDAKNELGRFIGESEPIHWMKGFIEKVAPLESSVLITGPSGVGKNLVAHIIHSLSKRYGEPLIKFNCASVPEETCECMLFGAERDIYKGIEPDIHGKIASANRGTLLLDKIEDMPLNVQRRLVGFLEHREIEQLGSKDPIPIDVRILATTNKNLRDLIHQGRFREDLFYRLNVVFINVPPLCDRLEDLPALVRHLLARINSRLSIHFGNVSNGAFNVLTSHDWPGNFRELENILERAAILSDGDILQEPEVRAALRETFCESRSKMVDPDQEKLLTGEGVCLKEVIQKVEKKFILEALTKTSGVQAEAAEILGLNPKNLWKKIQKHAIKVDRSTGKNAVAG